MDEGIKVSFAKPEEWEAAMELAWRTFLFFEGPEYSQEGIDNFLKFISEERLFQMFMNGEFKLAVAKKDDLIVGVGALRAVSHVSLLFVDKDMHRKGIGRKLLTFLQEDLEKAGCPKLTVHASLYGVPFYKKLGFVESGEVKREDGIEYQPMVCFCKIKDM